MIARLKNGDTQLHLLMKKYFYKNSKRNSLMTIEDS